MKRTMLALATMAMVAAGSVVTANAQEVRVGPGGIHIGPRHDCRVIIDHHTNRYGDDVTVRRRVCD